MKRVTINALVDIGCLITFILSLITGLVLNFPAMRWREGRQLGHLDRDNQGMTGFSGMTCKFYLFRPAYHPYAPALEFFSAYRKNIKTDAKEAGFCHLFDPIRGPERLPQCEYKGCFSGVSIYRYASIHTFIQLCSYG